MLFPVIVKKLKTLEVSILIIRQERPEDYDTVYHVVKEAFENGFTKIAGKNIRKYEKI